MTKSSNKLSLLFAGLLFAGMAVSGFLESRYDLTIFGAYGLTFLWAGVLVIFFLYLLNRAQQKQKEN